MSNTKSPILRPRVARWALHVCCNSPENGMATGFVDSIQFGLGRGNFDYGTDWLDEHELSICGPGVAFRWLDSNHFRLSRRKYRCLGAREWVGNWCWDACFVPTWTIRDIATVLAGRGWKPEVGSERLWRWFEKLNESEASDE